jgi:hypothetical protein
MVVLGGWGCDEEGIFLHLQYTTHMYGKKGVSISPYIPPYPSLHKWDFSSAIPSGINPINHFVFVPPPLLCCFCFGPSFMAEEQEDRRCG